MLRALTDPQIGRALALIHEENLDTIAQLVRHDPTAAFSKAFEREMGVAQGLFRLATTRRP